jgi:hypothetical protein
MLCLIWLVIFFIQFLVVLAALLFTVFLARPKIALSWGQLPSSDHD